MGGMLKWLFNKPEETPEDKFRREVAEVRDRYERIPVADKHLFDAEFFSYVSKFQQKLRGFAGENDPNIHLEQNFRPELDFIERLLQSFDYGPELKNYFKAKERQIFMSLNELDMTGSRQELLQTFCDTIFEAFQEDYPELKPPPVVISEDEPRTLGWVHVDYDLIESGDFGPVFIGAKQRGLYEDLHTVAHEASHHIMMQFVSLYARGDVNFSEAFSHDFERRFEQVKRNGFGMQEVKRLYHADPDEYLAFHMGYVTQFLYTAGHNFNNMQDAFLVINNMDDGIDALARGKPLPLLEESLDIPAYDGYNPK